MLRRCNEHANETLGRLERKRLASESVHHALYARAGRGAFPRRGMNVYTKQAVTCARGVCVQIQLGNRGM